MNKQKKISWSPLITAPVHWYSIFNKVWGLGQVAVRNFVILMLYRDMQRIPIRRSIGSHADSHTKWPRGTRIGCMNNFPIPTFIQPFSCRFWHKDNFALHTDLFILFIKSTIVLGIFFSSNCFWISWFNILKLDRIIFYGLY